MQHGIGGSVEQQGMMLGMNVGLGVNMNAIGAAGMYPAAAWQSHPHSHTHTQPHNPNANQQPQQQRGVMRMPWGQPQQSAGVVPLHSQQPPQQQQQQQGYGLWAPTSEPSFFAQQQPTWNLWGSAGNSANLNAPNANNLNNNNNNNTSSSNNSIVNSSTQHATEDDAELEQFLYKLNLLKYKDILKQNEVDLAVLPLMSEHDLAELGLPKGPRLKILKALAMDYGIAGHL